MGPVPQKVEHEPSSSLESATPRRPRSRSPAPVGCGKPTSCRFGNVVINEKDQRPARPTQEASVRTTRSPGETVHLRLTCEAFKPCAVDGVMACIRGISRRSPVSEALCSPVPSNCHQVAGGSGSYRRQSGSVTREQHRETVVEVMQNETTQGLAVAEWRPVYSELQMPPTCPAAPHVRLRRDSGRSRMDGPADAGSTRQQLSRPNI